MKKLNKFKWFFLGVIFCTIISTTIIPALASSGSRPATLNYNNIRITLDGEKLNPTDANGNTVEPFTIDGTTYLPVRAVANALGLNITWDSGSNTVVLTRKNSTSTGGDTSATSATPIGTLLTDSNGIKLSYMGIKDSDSYFGGKDVLLKIENNTSDAYTFQARNESINGIMCSSVFSCNVAAGKVAYDKLHFEQKSLDDNHVTSVDSLECNFHIFKNSNWASYFDTSTITLVF